MEIPDEEGRMKEQRTRRSDALRYVEKKLVDKGFQRMERHPADGLGGLGQGPPKAGHGGKYTWEGPVDEIHGELDPVPPAIDPRDPNYVEDEDRSAVGDEDEEEEQLKEEVVVGEVEVAKVAEAREGVARVEVRPPL